MLNFDETEMDAAYGAIVEPAKSKNTTANITITTAREKDVADESHCHSCCFDAIAQKNVRRELPLDESPGSKGPFRDLMSRTKASISNSFTLERKSSALQAG
jgi:hypothetical protein